MKKRIFITFLSLICTLACVFGLAACFGGSGGGDGTDIDAKASQNAEFVAYRKQVVAVLKDNDIYVNDWDDIKQSKTKNAKNAYASVQFSATSRAGEGRDAIKNAVFADGNKTDALEWATNVRNDMLEQSFYISLIVGDALLSNFNETSVFDIPVGWPATGEKEIFYQYVKLVKRENIVYALVYTPAFYNGKDAYMVAWIDYTGATDYTFTFLQYAEDFSEVSYIHGNSGKEFFYLQESPYIEEESDKGKNPYANCMMYAPNETEAYRSEANLTQCFESVRNEFSAFSVQEIRTAQTDKHLLTVKARDDLLRKYFDSSVVGKVEEPIVSTRQGIVFAERTGGYEKINGKRIAIAYYASPDEAMILLPENEDYYLSPDFWVYGAAVTGLTIPSNVVGIAKMDNSENWVVGDASNFIIMARADDTVFTMERIVVKPGSPIFQSGSGHLRSLDGTIVYLCNFADTSLNLNQLSLTCFSNLNDPQLDYTRLLNSVRTIEVEYERDHEYVLYEGLLKFRALSVINLTGDFTGDNRNGYIRLKLSTSVTVNCRFTCKADPQSLPSLDIGAPNGRINVTVNMVGLSKISRIYTDSNASVTVRFEYPEKFYNFNTSDMDMTGLKFEFSEAIMTDAQASVFRFETHERSGEVEGKAVLDRREETNVTEIKVPETLEHDITALEISEYFVSRIELSEKIKYILFEGTGALYQQPLTLCYSGTAEQFEQNVQIICYAEDYAFTLEYNGGSKTYSGNKAVPQEELCTVTLSLGARTITIPNVRKNKELYLNELSQKEQICNLLQSDVQYAWLGSDGKIVKISPPWDDLGSRNLGDLVPSDDTEYRLVKLRCDRNGRQSFTASKNGFTLSTVIYWSSASYSYDPQMENNTATYNGKSYDTGGLLLYKVNLFYCNDKKEETSTQIWLNVTFKIVVDNEGYLAIEIDTVTENAVR